MQFSYIFPANRRILWPSRSLAWAKSKGLSQESAGIGQIASSKADFLFLCPTLFDDECLFQENCRSTIYGDYTGTKFAPLHPGGSYFSAYAAFSCFNNSKALFN